MIQFIFQLLCGKLVEQGMSHGVGGYLMALLLYLCDQSFMVLRGLTEHEKSGPGIVFREQFQKQAGPALNLFILSREMRFCGRGLFLGKQEQRTFRPFLNVDGEQVHVFFYFRTGARSSLFLASRKLPMASASISVLR